MDRNQFFSTYFDKKKFEKKTFKISWQYLENDPLGVLKPVVDIIYGIEISFFQHILTKKKLKK